jgi:hypothetical protein
MTNFIVYRRRLQEGFHFAISHNNIHNLILEVNMSVCIEHEQVFSCVANS